MAVRLPVTFEPQSAMSLSSLVTSIDYKTGAIYDGDVSDQAKEGTGVFTWPNGDTYSGGFSNDKRNGKGEQVWHDGDRYVGDYVDDLRHGFGEYHWSNGEHYVGQFYKDHRHGPGLYTWADGSTFSGTYYMDRKEGYGTFRYANGDKFEGLYQADEREGPGVLTHADGTQDVGLWHRERLARLLVAVADTFSLADHPELAYDASRGRVHLPAEGRPDPQLDAFLEVIINPPAEWTSYDPAAAQRVRSRLEGEVLTGQRPDSAAFNHKESDASFRRAAGLAEEAEEADEATAAAAASGASLSASNQSPSHQQQQQKESPKKTGGSSSPSRSPKRTSPSRRSQPAKSTRRGRGAGGDTPDTPAAEEPAKKSPEKSTVPAWNPTPSSIEMQLHAIRFRRLQPRAGFDVDAVLRGDRTGFCQPGPLERRSVALIESAKTGDLAAVRAILTSGDVDPNVSDRLGKTPLLCASVNWHRRVVDCLLDAGADVNRLSDEGASCLGACFVHFYPSGQFQRNIAECPVKRLTEEEQRAARKAAARAAATAGAAGATAVRKPPAAGTTGGLTPLAEGKAAAVEAADAWDRLVDPVSGGGGGGRFVGTLTGARRPDFGSTAPRHHLGWSVSDDDDDDLDDNDDGGVGRRRGAKGGRPPLDEPELASAVSVGSVSPRQSEDFESTDSLANYKITVPEELVRRAATALSSNQMVASRIASSLLLTRTSAAAAAGLDNDVGNEKGEASGQEGRTREMAVQMAMHKLMSETVHLLLERGADPNASVVPFPVLFFAVKAGDSDMVRELLLRGADVTARLEEARGGLTALHIAVALHGEAGVIITELLLHSLAFPDARAVPDDSFLDRTLEEDWSRDEITGEQRMLLGGRTPLQIAASRDDDHKRAHLIVRLLLQHKANPNLLCNGNNSLTLAVQSGNDAAIEELLAYNVNVNLALSHGIGSALCAAANIAHEDKRPLKGRLDLVDRLMDAGADILQPIAIGVKRQLGTAVDYGWQSYYLDKRVAYTPYHALNPTERQAFQDRNILLKHLSNKLREKAVERERRRLEDEEADGVVSRGPSENFVYTGAGASMPGTRDSGDEFLRQQEVIVRRPIFKYCYDCGRSVGVRLTPCTRCKEVYFCSKACKMRAWNDRHKDECQRIGGGTGPRKGDASRIDSPTPATDADRGLAKPRVRDLSRHLAELRMRNPMKGRSRSAVGGGGDRDGSPQHQQQYGKLLPPIKGQRSSGGINGRQQLGRLGKTGGASLPEGASYQYFNGRYILVDALGRPLKLPSSFYQQQMLGGESGLLMMPDNYSFE